MTDKAPNAIESAPPPRAFAQGVGVLLQTVGVILALSGCCICSTAGLWDQQEGGQNLMVQPDQLAGIAIDRLLEKPARAGMMLTVVFSTIGGLAMAGFGLGMQSQTPRSAWGALASVILLLAILIVAGIGLWVGQGTIANRLWHAGLTVLVLTLAGFTISALRQVIAHPPPPGLRDLPPGFDVRDVLAGEKPSRRTIEQLRARLEVEQRKLKKLEQDLED